MVNSGLDDVLEDGFLALKVRRRMPQIVTICNIDNNACVSINVKDDQDSKCKAVNKWNNCYVGAFE